ncbi:MAG: hypothetical protein ACKPKO_52410, partial [Candidatus Fonsibacter sp.]
KTLKGVSKTVVKKEIKHDDYIHVKDTNKPIINEVVSIRSFNHHIYTYKQKKVALTSLYDKMKMVDNNNNIPFGYNPSNEIPEIAPDVDTDEEENFTPEQDAT